MSSIPNNIGYVREFCLEKVLDKDGVYVSKASLKVNLKNTLGETKTIVLDAPLDLVEFFEP